MNPFVFIVGCPRSGTTLLQRILDAHPHVAITPETHWIPGFYKQGVGLTAAGEVTAALLPELLAFRTFAKLKIGRQDLEQLLPSRQRVSYADFVSAIFDLYGRSRGKPLVGDKTPGYARSLPLLHSLWPVAKFVHLLRDGRDVCLSLNAWEKAGKLVSRFGSWSDHPAVTAALFWEQHVRLCRQTGQSLGPGLYYEIRYEALVDRPAEESAKLCAFLGVPYDEAMLRFHEGRTRTKPGLDAKHAWLPVTPGLRDWRSHMPAEDAERFEAAAGGFLEELGYPRAYPQPRAGAREEVVRARAAFPLDFSAYSQRASLSQA
jgi:hypothetical protein